MVTKYLNDHRRKYLMACLRNLLFEYTNYEDKFVEMQVPRDICKLLIDEQGLSENHLPETWKAWKAKQAKTLEQIKHENTKSLIDCLVLLANSEKLLMLMHEMDLQGLLAKVLVPNTKEYEDVSTRVEVLVGQLSTAGMPPLPEEEEEDQNTDDIPVMNMKALEDDLPALEE